jgi:hypothetical protein
MPSGITVLQEIIIAFFVYPDYALLFSMLPKLSYAIRSSESAISANGRFRSSDLTIYKASRATKNRLFSQPESNWLSAYPD